MKKVLAVSLMILMVLCMSFCASAKTGEFVQSPSNNKAPLIVDFSSESKDCYAKVIITAFQERDKLFEEERVLIEKAYKEIANSKNITDLCPELSEIAKKSDIPGVNLSVSDLFNVDHTDCDDHSKHGKFNLTIKSDTFKNFVALMCYTADGWKVIENAEIKMVNGEYRLVFSTKEVGPFAIVVNSAVVADRNPHTGDTDVIYLCAFVLAASSLAVLVALKKTKKQTV